ncbi:alpha/beta hydrolase [Cognatiluteimonas weifangensis]|nr:alpha/beta hydrolase [Luteimonas weifangensis]
MGKRKGMAIIGVAVCMVAAAAATAWADPPAGWQDRAWRGEGLRRVHPAGQRAQRDALPAGVRRIADLAYGADPTQRLDAYLPARPNGEAVLLVHGGGWKRGDKANRAVVANKLADWSARGIVVVSVDYRMLPETDPLQQAGDVAAALAYAQRHARGWGADPARFVLVGHSAGAHLVALLDAAPALGRAHGARAWRGTVALDSAALDVAKIMGARHPSLYDDAFGADPAYWRAASPTLRLARGAHPILLVCSSERANSCNQARDFASAARRLGVRAEVLPQALSHREINESLGLPGAYTDAVDAFIASLPAPASA